MISAFAETKVVHLTIDSGATVSFIIVSEAKRLNYKIESASQLAQQADGDTLMHVLGEVHEKVTRGEVIFEIHALVVKKLNDATILVGMNFLMENKVAQEPYKHRIVVNNKYTIEETPAKFVYPTDTPSSKTVNIKRVKILAPNETLDIDLPEDYTPSSKFIIDSTDQANSDQDWLCQEVEAVNRCITMKNDSGKFILLGKNQETSVIKIRPVVDISEHARRAQIIKTQDSSNLVEFNQTETQKLMSRELIPTIIR